MHRRAGTEDRMDVENAPLLNLPDPREQDRLETVVLHDALIRATVKAPPVVRCLHVPAGRADEVDATATLPGALLIVSVRHHERSHGKTSAPGPVTAPSSTEPSPSVYALK